MNDKADYFWTIELDTKTLIDTRLIPLSCILESKESWERGDVHLYFTEAQIAFSQETEKTEYLNM